MVCPFIEGGTRQCKEKFSSLVKDVSIDFCKSKDFSNCPLYTIINDGRPFCEHIEYCANRFHRLKNVIRHDSEIYKKIMPMIHAFCLYDNKKNCARYLLQCEGKFIPNALLQDGTLLRPTDFLKDIKY